MKRFTTLILMLSILLTFTQKVVAFAPVLNAQAETVLKANCSMPIAANDSHMDKMSYVVDEMSPIMDCQIDCDFMTIASVFYLTDHNHSVIQLQSLLAYQTGTSVAPYYFSELLYRPPFIN